MKKTDINLKKEYEGQYTLTRTTTKGKNSITEQIPISNKLKLFRIEEASKILNIIPRNLRKAIYNGELKASKIGNKIFITEESIADYIKLCEDKVLTKDKEIVVRKK